MNSHLWLFKKEETMTLEERITRLEDIEAIRQLQAKYQRCLDTRDFDGIAECFTDDAQSAYGNGTMSYDGKEAILGFLRRVMTRHIPSTHLIHGGEIDVTPSVSSSVQDGSAVLATAHAKWYLEDYLLHRLYLAKLHGAAIYDVDYVKLCIGEGCSVSDGSAIWKIRKIGYTRCYEYFELRGLVNLFTLGKTTFLDLFSKKK